MRWAGSGGGPAVFALTEAGGPLTDLGALTGSDPERRCRAEIRVDTPAGPWTVRLASLISDAPAGLLWDTEGLLLVKYGFHVYAFEARTGELRWTHRSASPVVVLVGSSRLPHVIAQAEIETFALRADGEVGWRVAHSDVVTDAELVGGRLVLTSFAGEVARARPAHGTRHRLSTRAGGRLARDRPRTGPALTARGQLPQVARCGVDKCVDPAGRGRVALDVSPKGPSDANGRDHLKVHASSRFLRAVDSPRAPPPAGATAVCDHRPVIPLLLIVGGMLAVVAAWWLLRGMGPGARIGRIIAATRVVPVSRAVALAGRGGSAVRRRAGAHRRGRDARGREPAPARPAPPSPGAAGRPPVDGVRGCPGGRPVRDQRGTGRASPWTAMRSTTAWSWSAASPWGSRRPRRPRPGRHGPLHARTPAHGPPEQRGSRARDRCPDR